MSVEYCARCGIRSGTEDWGPLDPRFCWWCFEGVADAARAREIVEAAAVGSPGAAAMLSNIGDPRAFDVLIETLERDDPALRYRALHALRTVGDSRAVDAVAALIDDPDPNVRSTAVWSLRELNSQGAADALAAKLDANGLGTEVAMALAWLEDARAFAPLVELLLEPERAWTRNGSAFEAFAWLGDRRAAPYLVAGLERLVEIWEAAGSIMAVLLWFGGDNMEEAVEDAGRRVGGVRARPLVHPPAERRFSYPTAADERRTVPKWSLELHAVHVPITEPVTKFGGQPVWLDQPTWPLTRDLTPMTFFAQFRVPGSTRRMAYLFIDVQGGLQRSDDGDAAVVVQPGVRPATFERRPTGPSYVSYAHRGLGLPHAPWSRRGLRESAAALVEGRDPPDWSSVGPDMEKTDFDWNKVGGTPLFLQSDEWPRGDGRRFLAQFTAALVGHDFGDAGECYVFVTDDGRGAFFWQCS